MKALSYPITLLTTSHTQAQKRDDKTSIIVRKVQSNTEIVGQKKIAIRREKNNKQ